MKRKPLPAVPTALVLVAIFSLVAGTYMHGFAVDSDSEAPLGRWVGAFLIFVFWSLGVAAWGMASRTWLRLDGEPVFESLALGTAGAVLTAQFFGHVGLVGAGAQPVMLFLLVAGHAVNLGLARKPGTEGSGAGARRAGWFTAAGGRVSFGLVALAGLIVVTLMLKSSLPHGASDELRYHLVGPRMWFERGAIYFPERVPLALQCSYWEYLFLWANVLLGAPYGKGLIEGQLFGQWVSVLFGAGGVALAMHALGSRLSAAREWVSLAALATLCLAPLGFPWLAKNDWGVAFWVVAGVTFLWREPAREGSGGLRRERAYLVAGGALLGLGFAAKFTALFAVAPIALYWAYAVLRHWPRSTRFRTVGLALAGFGGVALPILVRNAVYTGNPVFPAFAGVFGSDWLGPTWLAHQSFYEVKGLRLAPAELLKRSLELVRACPSVLALGVFAPWLEPRLRPLVIATAAGFVLFNLKVNEGLGDSLRLFGPGLALLSGLSVLAVGELWERVKPRPRRLAQCCKALMFGSVVALCLLQSPWRIWRDILSSPPPGLAIRQVQIGGDTKAWLRLNVNPGELIVTTGDDQIYYFSHLDAAVLTEQPTLDRETAQLTDARAIFAVLRRHHARYLLDTCHWAQRFWSARAAVLDGLIREYPGAVVYRGRDARVVDLEKITVAL